MTFPIENYTSLTHDKFAEIRERVQHHTSVKHGLDWFLAMAPPVPPADCLPQDEFSNDVIFPHPDGLWVVYECT